MIMTKGKTKKDEKLAELNEDAFNELSDEEKDALLTELIMSDPRTAFFDLALSAFDEGDVDEFDYFAGMAVQYSDCSVLVEMAMTLLKTMLIIKEKDPDCARIPEMNLEETEEEELYEIADGDSYLRLNLLAELVMELIKEENEGRLTISDEFESGAENLLGVLLDRAAERQEEIMDRSLENAP
jgi:hypothetical protein